MRPADGALAEIHDRVPLLIPANFASEWMTSDASAAALIDDALAQSASALAAVGARPIVSRPA
jgi:putative SOS response-associated peptidase YedK